MGPGATAATSAPRPLAAAYGGSTCPPGATDCCEPEQGQCLEPIRIKEPAPCDVRWPVNCEPKRCDPLWDASCHPDPCFYGPTAPGCKPDPCEQDPFASGCGTEPPPGGGDGENPPPDDLSSCDPALRRTCEQPLKAADKSTLQKALADHLRDPADIPDPGVRARCQEMASKFHDMLTNNRVFRGDLDTPQNDPNTGWHYGAYSPITKNIHFDPDKLDAANAGNANMLYQLANTALHEAAHALGKDHGKPFGTVPGLGPIYTEPYFADLNGGTNSCVH